MSTATRNPYRPVTQSLRAAVTEEPQRFELFALIDALASIEKTDDPLGGGDIGQAVVRLRNRRDPTPSVVQVDRARRAADGRWDVYTGLMNLVGPNGSLDLSDGTSILRNEPIMTQIDCTVHLRLSRYYASYRAAQARPETKPPRHLLCSAMGLQTWIAHRFGIRAEIIPCRGEWSEIGAARRLRYTRMRRAQLVLGPMAERYAIGLLPGAERLHELVRLLAEVADAEWDIELQVRRDSPSLLLPAGFEGVFETAAYRVLSRPDSRMSRIRFTISSSER